MAKVFVVKEDHLDGDVIPEHSDHVLGQAEHLRQPAVVHAISCPAKRTSDQVCRSVGICWLQSHSSLSLFE